MPDALRGYVDALAMFCAHVTGCESRVPLAGATVIVVLTLDDLQSATGSATVDGMDHPVNIGAARRMAAGGGVIPWVCGGGSEILDRGERNASSPEPNDSPSPNETVGAQCADSHPR